MSEAKIMRVGDALAHELKKIQDEMFKMHGVTITTAEASNILMKRRKLHTGIRF